VAADVLKVEHDAGEFFRCHFLTLNGCVAYAEVLAKDAEQVASGEENRPATAPSSQAVFFAQVRTVTANFGVATNGASSQLPIPTVGMAFARADAAIFEHFFGSLNLLPDATASVCLQVNGLKIFSRDDEAFAKLRQSPNHFPLTSSPIEFATNISELERAIQRRESLRHNLGTR
jgi:hypothetical protein